MKRILEEFNRVNIYLKSRRFEPNSRYGRVMEVLADCEKRLEAALSKEDRKIFEKYNKSQIEIELLMSKDKFIYGYQLGILTAHQPINGKNERGDD